MAPMLDRVLDGRDRLAIFWQQVDVELSAVIGRDIHITGIVERFRKRLNLWGLRVVLCSKRSHRREQQNSYDCIKFLQAKPLFPCKWLDGGERGLDVSCLR